jgi:drug/metabolite transporter (DMT)-like permease
VVILGYVFAVLAALASGSGSILESIGVRRAQAFGGTSMDLVNLRHQPIYFLGIGVDLLGFLAAALALRQLPLFLVQSLLAFSVAVTATISAFLGMRLASAGWVAVGVGAVGLALLGVSAEPGPAQPLPPQWRWVLLAMALPVAAIAGYAQRRKDRWAAPLLSFGAGLGFCVVGVSARTLTLPEPAWRVVLEPSLWAIPVNGFVAAVLFAMALQKTGATANTAILFTTSTALSSLIGVLYLDDRVREGFLAAALVGFACAVAGAVGTAHYASVAQHRTEVAEPSRD